MFRTIALIPVLVLATASTTPARDPGSRVDCVGGTVFQQVAGGMVRTTDQQFFEFDTKAGNLRVDYTRINLIEYGQKVDRRYAMAVIISPVFLLSKKRQHFLTVGYTDDEGRQQALVFKVDKNDIRGMLVSLEARTGRKVQFQDEEARKAGKG
jgi:hypothetical protein